MPGRRCVSGVGNPKAKIMLVGEALGKDEAEKRTPFVGRCGQFLDIMLKNAGLDRKDLYITNTVKGRPHTKDGKFTRNRPPTDEEIQSCKKWLAKEIKLIEPKIIFTLGSIPTRLLLSLDKKQTLKSVVGTYSKVSYTEATIIPMYHPSYICTYRSGLQYSFEAIIKKTLKEYNI